MKSKALFLLDGSNSPGTFDIKAGGAINPGQVMYTLVFSRFRDGDACQDIVDGIKYKK